MELVETNSLADILNDKVLRFFEDQQLPILRILTDRGTEIDGKSIWAQKNLAQI